MTSCKTSMLIGLIQIFLALLACLLAFYIPVRIMREQTYSSLMSDYRGYDFAIAIQGIIEFFIIECDGKIENISEKYKARFLKEIYGYETKDEINFSDLKEWAKTEKRKAIVQTEPALCLHYQRRLLAQFFYQLDLCANYSIFYKKRVQRDFTKNEAKIIRILLAINQAIDNDPILKKSLDCEFYVRPKNKTQGMNNYLSDLFFILDKGKPFMQI